jgi:hypothetical protein
MGETYVYDLTSNACRSGHTYVPGYSVCGRRLELMLVLSSARINSGTIPANVSLLEDPHPRGRLQHEAPSDWLAI